ncbi:hypothetical protein ACU4GD_30100 [Cupriavidus basilensis]
MPSAWRCELAALGVADTVARDLLLYTQATGHPWGAAWSGGDAGRPGLADPLWRGPARRQSSDGKGGRGCRGCR